MRCADARDRLVAASGWSSAEVGARGTPVTGASRSDAELAAHLGSCADCAAFASQLVTWRAGLAAHRSDHVPGPDFAARVVTQLPDTTELIGWAALRLLPAAFALAIACSWFGLSRGPGLSELLLHPDDPLLLTYVLLGEDVR